jgi:hypothetical protein
MRGSKLRSDTNWQGALKQEGVKIKCKTRAYFIYIIFIQLIIRNKHIFVFENDVLIK